MSAISTTRRLIEAYASEPWKEQHDQAMLCRDIEEAMAWGVRLYRGLMEEEAAIQARALARRGEESAPDLSEFEEVFRQWVATSEMVLRVVERLADKGLQVDGLDVFRRVAEEARCQLELWDLEPEILPIEEALSLVRPENPRPNRYGV